MSIYIICFLSVFKITSAIVWEDLLIIIMCPEADVAGSSTGNEYMNLGGFTLVICIDYLFIQDYVYVIRVRELILSHPLVLCYI